MANAHGPPGISVFFGIGQRRSHAWAARGWHMYSSSTAGKRSPTLPTSATAGQRRQRAFAAVGHRRGVRRRPNRRHRLCRALGGNRPGRVLPADRAVFSPRQRRCRGDQFSEVMHDLPCAGFLQQIRKRQRRPYRQCDRRCRSGRFARLPARWVCMGRGEGEMTWVGAAFRPPRNPHAKFLDAAQTRVRFGTESAFAIAGQKGP
jgi:hypothetical protein